MECFNHPGKQSVALCKICHKALCHICCQFGCKSYVCSDICAEEEDKLNQVTTWSTKYIGSGRKGSLMTRQYAYNAIGLAIISFAILSVVAYDYFILNIPAYPPLIIIGTALLIVAALIYKGKPR